MSDTDLVFGKTSDISLTTEKTDNMHGRKQIFDRQSFEIKTS